MPKRNLVQNPDKFNDQNVEHLERPAEVVIIKKLRNFIEPGSMPQSEIRKDQNVGDKTEAAAFRKDFVEFIEGEKKILTPNFILDNKWLDPVDGTGNTPLYRHWQITASTPKVLGDPSQVDSLTPGATNTDVYQITASLTTEGRGQCTVVLNSRQDKYVFTEHPLRNGKVLFESNDQIYVNLPGLDGELYRAFTGYITTVQLARSTAGGLRTTITLTCDDMLKPLVETRTCIRPSGFIAENRGVTYTGLSPVFANKLPHEILSFIMSRAYADVYSHESFRPALEASRELGRAGDLDSQTEAALRENALFESTLSLPQPSAGISVSADSRFLATWSQSVAHVRPLAGGVIGKTPGEPVTLPKRIFGFRRERHETQIGPGLNPVVQELEQYSPFSAEAQVDPDDLAFIIEGTSQPSYKLAFGADVSIFASEWKSALLVGQEIAKNINYEFFADELGIVHFRPINANLPYDFEADEPRRVTTALTWKTQRVGYEYWLKDQFTTDEAYVETDKDIFTIAYAFGAFQVDGLPEGAVKGVAVDVNRFLKLGARQAPAITKMNLLTDDAANNYARAYLARLNANAMTGRIKYIGDARVRVGNPVYVEKNNQVYYLSSLVHNYTVGQGYSMSMELKYGRVPISTAGFLGLPFGEEDAEGNSLVPKIFQNITSTSMQNQLYRYDEQSVLASMEEKDTGNSFVGKLSQGARTEADYIRDNKLHLTFQGYLWEPLYTLKYEDLNEGLLIKRLCQTTSEAATADATNSGQARKIKQEAETQSRAELIRDSLAHLNRPRGGRATQ